MLESDLDSNTHFRHEINQLHARYGAAYDRADEQLRRRPVLLAALYLKDVVHMGLTCLGSTALCVPALWFWGAVSDFGSVQKALAAPVDSAALWGHAEAIFVVVFVMLLGLSIFRGGLGRSRSARVHAEAQLLFASAPSPGDHGATAKLSPDCTQNGLKDQPR